MDLLSLPARFKERKTAKMRAELINHKRVATSMGIIAQLHLAVIDYEFEKEQYAQARKISDVRLELVQAMGDAMKEGKAHAGEFMDPQAKYFTARSRYLMTYANLMTSQARIRHSLGVAPPEQIEQEEATPVAENIEIECESEAQDNETQSQEQEEVASVEDEVTSEDEIISETIDVPSVPEEDLDVEAGPLTLDEFFTDTGAPVLPYEDYRACAE